MFSVGWIEICSLIGNGKVHLGQQRAVMGVEVTITPPFSSTWQRVSVAHYPVEQQTRLLARHISSGKSGVTCILTCVRLGNS